MHWLCSVSIGTWIVWLLSVRVSLYQNGIAYQSIFGKKELLWVDVERFYYSALKRSVNFIPVGTYYSFKLVTARGERMSFGNRIERPADVASRLIQATYPALFHKSADVFDNGMELDFGPVKLSHSGGLNVKKLFRTVRIPLDSLADYRMERGSFYVWRVGQKRPVDTSIGKIPNAFVLIGVLDAIYKPPPNNPAEQRCQECGSPMDRSFKFCIKCGKRIGVV